MTDRRNLALLPVDARPPRLCPVCGVRPYSREGVHPQCAGRQARAAKPAAGEPPRDAPPRRPDWQSQKT